MQRGWVEHMRWMWFLTDGFRLKLLLYVLLEVLSICLGLIFVVWTKKVVDAAVLGETAFVSIDLLVMLSSLLLAVIARTIAGWVNERTKLKMRITTQQMLLERQLRATWQFLNKWTSGDLQIRIQEDAAEVVQMAGHRVWSAGITALSLVAFLSLLAWFDTWLALLLFGVSLLFGFAKVYFRKTKALHKEIKAAQSGFGHVVQESIQFKLLIRALSIYPIRWKRVQSSLEQIGRLEKLLINFTTFSHGVVRLLGGIGFLLAFCWGLYRLHLGLITFGSLTAFLQLVGRIQAPVLSLMAFAPLAIRARVATDRLMDIMNVEVEPEQEEHHMRNLKALKVENLSFKYEEELVIDEFSMQVAKGESVAIMGASGKGKTTFVRLLLGLLTPTAGKIVVETDKEAYPLTIAHRVNMAYVPQGGKLFRGTVWENLEVMKPEVTAEEIKQAIYLGAAEFIYDLPQGLDTQVGEEGYGLSGGQAQRIAIARAMLRDSSIWILDELTSALDEETAKAVVERLLSAGANKIILIVTHDMELAKRCSKIIYI